MTRTARVGGVKACISFVALLGFTTPAFAGACATQAESAALRTAAMQQQLMVAALSCHQSDLYNRFVTTYRDALVRSDAELRHYFDRERGGITAYHSYKTRLANAASLDSLHDMVRYCADASTVFHAALDRGEGSLASLLAAMANAAPPAAACADETRIAERSAPR